MFAWLEILGQLPDTVVLVASISAISTFYMFLRSWNPSLAVSQSYHVRMISKIQINFRFPQVLEDTDDWVLWIFVIFSLPTFSGSRNPFLAVSQNYCSGDLKNPGQLPVWQVLEGTDDWVLWIFVISSLPTFLGSRNPFLAVSQSYYVRVTSKNPGQFPVSQVLEGTDDWVLWNFVISSLPTFWGRWIHSSQFHKATSFGWSRKSWSTSGLHVFEGTITKIRKTQSSVPSRPLKP